MLVYFIDKYNDQVIILVTDYKYRLVSRDN